MSNELTAHTIRLHITFVLLVLLLGATATSAETTSSTDYRLAAGDLVSINVFNEANLSMQVRVNARGMISYPILGEIPVEGKTTKEIESMIGAGLSGSYLVDPQVNVNIVEFRKYFVSGAVKQGGAFQYSPGLTFKQALSIAGGAPEITSENVMVIHETDANHKPVSIDLHDLVQPGDQIEVSEPQLKEVIVEGAVNTPGVIPYKSGMTVHRAISAAGGPNERASNTITIVNEKDPEHTSREVDIFTQVKPGDIIRVEESFF